LVLISQHLGSKSALFIGQLSSLKIIPLPLTAFLVDLLAFYHIGRHRIQSAHKAFYNDRLATVGRIASRVSHEARNRLDSLRGALELLKAGREELLSAEHRCLLLQEFEVFLSEFAIGLDMARADAAKIEDFSARAVINEVLTLFKPCICRTGIQLEAHFRHEVDGVSVDKRLLRQALFNLLRNSADALQYTSGPSIVLSGHTNCQPLAWAQRRRRVGDAGLRASQTRA
jgi:signal transduction histidine kinase